MNPIIFQFNSIQLFIIIVCISLFQFLLSNWIKNRLEKSIQHEYDKKLEEYKFLQIQRQKAEIIAKFFAKWIKFKGKENVFLERKELLDYYEDLNQMSFEISLWISDDKILQEVMKRFQNSSEAKNIRQLVGEFRKLILNIKSDNFNIQEIVLWPTDTIAEEIGLINNKK